MSGRWGLYSSLSQLRKGALIVHSFMGSLLFIFSMKEWTIGAPLFTSSMKESTTGALFTFSMKGWTTGVGFLNESLNESLNASLNESLNEFLNEYLNEFSLHSFVYISIVSLARTHNIRTTT